MKKILSHRLSTISTGRKIGGFLVFIGFLFMIFFAIQLSFVSKEIYNAYLSIDPKPITLLETFTTASLLSADTNAVSIFQYFFAAFGVLWAGYILKTLCVIAETQLIDLHSDE